MNLDNFLGLMVNRGSCEVCLYTGDTLNKCEFIVSSYDDNLGVIGLIECFGDCIVAEYSIEDNILRILVKFDFKRHLDQFVCTSDTNSVGVSDVVNVVL